MYKQLFIVFVLINYVLMAPKHVRNNATEENVFIIDQSQNGTDNYRINVKDVIIIWAQPGALLAGASLLDHINDTSKINKKLAVVEENDNYSFNINKNKEQNR